MVGGAHPTKSPREIMTRTMAAIAALLAFAVCLAAGIVSDNPLSTTLSRALVAMAGTMVVGLVVGWMAQKMLDEHVAMRKKNSAAPENRENSEAKPAARDR
jgi:putative Mn2+ efflux pump MntP